MEAISKYMPMTRVGMKKVISNSRKFIYTPAESLLFHAVPRRVISTVVEIKVSQLQTVLSVWITCH